MATTTTQIITHGVPLGTNSTTIQQIPENTPSSSSGRSHKKSRGGIHTIASTTSVPSSIPVPVQTTQSTTQPQSQLPYEEGQIIPQLTSNSNGNSLVLKLKNLNANTTDQVSQSPSRTDTATATALPSSPHTQSQSQSQTQTQIQTQFGDPQIQAPATLVPVPVESLMKLYGEVNATTKRLNNVTKTWKVLLSSYQNMTKIFLDMKTAVAETKESLTEDLKTELYLLFRTADDASHTQNACFKDFQYMNAALMEFQKNQTNLTNVLIGLRQQYNNTTDGNGAGYNKRKYNEVQEDESMHNTSLDNNNNNNNNNEFFNAVTSSFK